MAVRRDVVEGRCVCEDVQLVSTAVLCISTGGTSVLYAIEESHEMLGLTSELGYFQLFERIRAD